LSQADTGDKLFSFLVKNMRFLPILKSFFKKQSKKIKKLGSKRHSARQNPYSANYPQRRTPRLIDPPNSLKKRNFFLMVLEFIPLGSPPAFLT
jgi:hypothetical protein